MNNVSRTRWFLISQAVIVPLLLTIPFLASGSMSSAPKLPNFQAQPLSIQPTYDDERVITDEQLQMVLHKLRPRLTGPEPKINHVDHAIRCWGDAIEFEETDAISGPRMRELLLNHQAFAKAWGAKQDPLLMVNENGVAIRTQEGAATASHVDHTIASLAEIGVPINTPIITPIANQTQTNQTQTAGSHTVRDILNQAILNFSVNQTEYEWTTLALALYAPSPQSWLSKEGQKVDFNILADRIMRQRYPEGVCYGNHRLYTLAVLLRVDDETDGILTEATRTNILNHLTEATRRLVATQSPEGWWDANWSTGQTIGKDIKFEPQARRLLATGHALEWWAIAPAELHPPRENLARAGQWLTNEIEQLDEETVVNNYTFLTHVCRALALWRGNVPANLYQPTQN